MWFYRWYGVVISCAWRRVWMIVIRVSGCAGSVWWEVLMWFDSEAVAQVSGVAETVDFFG